MNIKKVMVLLGAAVMGQMVVASDVDLYRGLLFWIKDQKNIEGNEARQTSLPLSTVLDGSKSITFSGAKLPERDTSAYSYAITFKVGELNCVNRLLVIGQHSVYLDSENTLYYNGLRTTFTVDSINKYYTLVFRVDESHRLTVFAGTKDQRLSQVMSSGISGYLDFSSQVGMSSFVLGYGSKPSAGNLQSGQFANIRFWTRALSDEECAMVDKSQNEFWETKPFGCPADVKYDFFPLAGNMFGVDEASPMPKCSSYNVTASGWRMCADRFGVSDGAMECKTKGKIIFNKHNELFDGNYIVNGGLGELSDRVYGYSKEVKITTSIWVQSRYKEEYGYYRFPVPTKATATSDCDATYSFWVYIDSWPTSGTVEILSRKSAPTKDAGNVVVNSNELFSVALNYKGNLVVSGSDVVITTLETIPTNEWSMISFVGVAGKMLTVFFNGKEAGNMPCGYSLGYISPVDQRQYRYSEHVSGFPSYCERFVDAITGGIVPVSATMEIGGWDGAIDDIQFYARALSTSEIKSLYEKGAPPDPNTSITPITRNFSTNGGGGAIITSGSVDTWWARVTEPWLTLSATSGNIGYPVAYTVGATTNAEQRVGYVYVNGHVHEVTQDGLGGSIDSTGATYEKAGGSGSIAVGVLNGVAWKATSNVDWLSVSPECGIGSGSVTYQVSAYNDVATRQGTLTIAGNTFTVFQYGRRMKLDSYSTTQNYETHVIPIMVNALDTTQWSVTPNNSWVSVIDAGNGHGGDLVTIAIAENPSYKARTGTVTIGTETFTVTQQGRPTEELEFSIDPESTTASVNGAYGLVAVIATPDLPWVATSGANWLTIYPATANGAGRANVAYNASPNPTLFERTGTIIVTPETASGLMAKTQTVVQPAAESSLSLGGYEFEAAGGSCSVEVSVADIVQWSADESIDWITVNGSTSRTGPGTVVLQAAANGTVYPRSGTVTIAGKSFSVSQRARGVEVEYESMLFGTDGGYESISIHPDGNSDWTAVASDPTWITIFQGDSGTGDGEIMYIVAPYNGDGSSRTGWIEVGDKKVYITQRPYELSVSPNGSVVKGNNGAGEFGVSANIGAVWNAIVTEPWIALVSGYDAGTGSGTVRFICADNNTGRPRVGKIIVAGEEYTVTQSARILVKIQAIAGHGGSITGAGTYDKGEKIVLTAVPDSGYQFVRWTGPVSSTANPLTMEADDLTGIKAEFEPMPVDFTSVVSSLDGVDLEWNTLAWATTYKLFRGETDDIASATELATFLNGVVDAYRDESGDRGVTYWYWVMAIGDEDDAVSMSAAGMRKPIVNSPITYQNLRGATHSNPDTYVEGRSVEFSHPSAIVGYTFAGWTPERITEDMTGAQTVRAAWAAHEYSIAYDANGGNGTMSATPATYDVEAKVAANGFTRTGYSFVGWATNDTGAVVFTAGQPVTNLTDVAGAKLTFYAVWTVNRYTVTFNANGGTGGKTVTQDYGTALAAPTVTRGGYTFSGWSPTVPATVPADNATYVAQWTKNKYTVTFDANGGMGGWSKSMDYGAAITAPAVTRAGYTFTGWVPAVAATVPASNVAYMAQWKINQYMVTFDANGGEGGKTVTQDYGTALAAPTVTRTGYTLTGWSPAVPSTMPAANATYVAQWTKNKYTVTFNANGGNGGWSRSMDYGATITVPAVTRTGYSFTGWTPAVAATVPAGNVSYTAQWKVSQYTVTFDANGGTGGKTVTQNYGTALSAPTVTREGYTFTGWSPTVATTVLAGNVTYTAQWKVNQYTVTFNANGGTGGKTVTQDYGTALTVPTVTRTGYTFNGWSPAVPSTMPAGNVTYVAQWTKNKYAVTFDANGGTGGWSRSMDYGVTITAPTVTRTGYSFTGWTPAVAATVPAGNVSYTAQWKVNQYTVTFDANGGTGGKTVTQNYGTALSAPTVTREGYTFTGWSPTVATTVPAGNVTYTAQWKVNQYTVTFDANGGTGGKTVTQDYGTALTVPTVTRTGYTFNGWSPAVPVTVPGGNATYVAQWTKNKYTVTFNANGGVGGWSKSLDYGAAITVPTVTRTGYTFSGWSSAVAKTVPIGGASYTAQWTINRHQVTLSLNGGDGIGSATVDYGTRVGDLPVPTREGYEFLGWFTAPTGGSRAADNAIVTGDMTLYAQWHIVLPELYEMIDGAAPDMAASEYNGYLYDENSGAVKGTVQVKVGKPGKKDGKATVKATVVVGTKKITLKGAEMGKAVIASDEPTEIELVGKSAEECSVMLGAYGITGFYGAYIIDGARNIFSSKDKGDLADAKDALDKCLGSRMVIWDGGSVSVSIAAKGKVKVSGTLASGAKVSATAVLLVGEEWNGVSVAAPRANLSFVLWLSRDGKTTMVDGLGDDVLVGKAGTLADGAVFSVSADAALWSAIPGTVLTEYLPDGVPVTKKGTKWTLPKVGRITMKKGVIDVSKAGENPSGLKLTYKAKDGTFKGSFKVYAENKGKLKATTVNVTGFLLNGIGFGTATIKKVGSVSVRIE